MSIATAFGWTSFVFVICAIALIITGAITCDESAYGTHKHKLGQWFLRSGAMLFILSAICALIAIWIQVKP